MKTGDGFDCDKCHEPISINDEREGSVLHYGRTDYHVGCYIDYLRSKGAIAFPKERKAS